MLWIIVNNSSVMSDYVCAGDDIPVVDNQALSLFVLLYVMLMEETFHTHIVFSYSLLTL